MDAMKRRVQPPYARCWLLLAGVRCTSSTTRHWPVRLQFRNTPPPFIQPARSFTGLSARQYYGILPFMMGITCFIIAVRHSAYEPTAKIISLFSLPQDAG